MKDLDELLEEKLIFLVDATGIPVLLSLLVLIFTEHAGAARRAWQRATWLRFRWHEAQLSQMAVPWRYVYVQGRTADSVEASLDVVHGDTVTLSAVSEGYRSLVHKTMEALRWAQAVCRPMPTPQRRRCQPGQG